MATITGTSGNDTLTGTSGADSIFAQGGNDLVNGGGGDDTIGGAGGSDTLNGGSGNDVVFGSNGIDRINGGSDNDELFGGGGNDTINGDAGADTLTGGSGGDLLTGGSGADIFRFANNHGTDGIFDFDPTEGDRITLGGDITSFSFSPTSLFSSGNDGIFGTGDDLYSVVTINTGQGTIDLSYPVYEIQFLSVLTNTLSDAIDIV